MKRKAVRWLSVREVTSIYIYIYNIASRGKGWNHFNTKQRGKLFVRNLSTCTLNICG